MNNIKNFKNIFMFTCIYLNKNYQMVNNVNTYMKFL